MQSIVLNMMRTTRSGRQYSNNEGYLKVYLNKPPEIVRRSRRLEEQKKGKLNVKQETNFFSFFNVGFKRKSQCKARNEEQNIDNSSNDISSNVDNGTNDGADDIGISGNNEVNNKANDVADHTNDINDDDSLCYSVYSTFEQNDYYFEDFSEENIELNQ